MSEWAVIKTELRNAVLTAEDSFDRILVLASDRRVVDWSSALGIESGQISGHGQSEIQNISMDDMS